MFNMLNIMLGIRLEPELEQKLESLAKETGRSKSYYAREAIRQYLEDREDIRRALRRRRRGNRPSRSEGWSGGLAWKNEISRTAEKQIEKLEQGTQGMNVRLLGDLLR